MFRWMVLMYIIASLTNSVISDVLVFYIQRTYMSIYLDILVGVRKPFVLRTTSCVDKTFAWTTKWINWSKPDAKCLSVPELLPSWLHLYFLCVHPEMIKIEPGAGLNKILTQHLNRRKAASRELNALFPMHQIFRVMPQHMHTHPRLRKIHI